MKHKKSIEEIHYNYQSKIMAFFAFNPLEKPEVP